MRNLTVGVFHCDDVARELGKSGTASDFLMFNRKTDDRTYTFIAPRDDKLSAKAEIMSAVDAAIISFAKVTPQVGETIVMLDSFGISQGVAIVPHGTVLNDIVALTKGTSVEPYRVKEPNPIEVLEYLEKLSSQRDAAAPTRVVVDHSFSVRGVGEVVLGFVLSGTVKKYDKLSLLPANKEVTVRSIQMHDKDFDSAEAGSRVGLCIKGATVEEMKRGSLICASGSAKCDKKLKLAFTPNKFYKGGPKEGAFHASAGMQTIPVKVSAVSADSVTIEAEKSFVHFPGETFLLMDINAEKMHVIGKGTV